MRRAAGISRNVVLLGVVSLLADVSSDMVMPLLPAFLVSLGAGAAYLGVIEGAAEATAALLKYLSGRWADRARRLLPLAVAGYALAAMARPFLAVVHAPWQVLLVRNIDRVGKGIRTSPRDKLLAESTEPARLAEAFSFHRGMDHAGAALGPLVAAALLMVWPGELRRVFLLAAIPGGVAVIALFAVRETARERKGKGNGEGEGKGEGEGEGEGAAGPVEVEGRQKGPQASDRGPQASDFGLQASGQRGVRFVEVVHNIAEGVPLRLLGAIGIFTLGNSTDVLLVLRAQTVGVPTAQLPLLWALLHVVRSTLSWPLGRAADKLGRRGALAAGWLWYAVCYAGFALARGPSQIWILFAAYGLVAAMTEGTERALITAAVSGEHRGRALGVYNLVSGIGLLLASVLAGQVWDRVSPQAALLLGAALAFAAAVLLGSGRAAAAETV
jgi:MFS family permease